MGIVKTNLYRIAQKSWLPRFTAQSIFPYYHIVTDKSLPHIIHLYPYKNRKQFELDLELLLEYYKPLHPEDLLDSEKIPANRFLLTFDDGLSEIYSVIYPILKAKNLSAVFFINPDYVGNHKSMYKHDISLIIDHLQKSGFLKKKLDKIANLLHFTYLSVADFLDKFKNIAYADRVKITLILEFLKIEGSALKQPFITTEQLQQMIDDGFYFGGHTMSHPPLNQISFDEQRREMLDSIEWLKNNFGIEYSLFAFPFTDRGISKKLISSLFDYDPNMIIFGNAGLKKDIHPRIIQRFSLENPHRNTAKQIVTEHLYKMFNKIIGNYLIKRK